MMKKLIALVLALLMMSMTLASCGDGIDGKSFTYEKIEVEFENEEVQKTFEKLLEKGQKLEDYFTEHFLGEEVTGVVYTFKDGKMSAELGGKSLGDPIEYKKDGNNITFGDKEMSEGSKMYLKDGKFVMEMAMEIPVLVTTIDVTVKVIYKQK